MKPRPCIVASLGREARRDISALDDADMVEVRLDLVAADPLDALKEIRRAVQKPIIVTNRMKSEGGRFEGSEQERLELLCRAAGYADYVDIELKAERRADFLGRIDKPAIVSFHDFHRMPGLDELRSILQEMKSADAAIAKIAVTPSCLKDNLILLNFLLEADMPLCVIAMGELGRHLRAVAPLYGSALTYGYVSEPTAPGQMSINELSRALDLLNPASCNI
jgi:3-dehydroquinate dehydratase-1